MSLTDSDALLSELRKIVRALDLHSRWLNKSFALTGPQLVCLTQIGRQEGLTIGALARQTSLSCATATGIVDRLEQRGLVVRDRNGKDRRQVRLNLTEEGRLLSERRPPLLQETFLASLDQLGAEEKVRMLEGLRRLAGMMTGMVEERLPKDFTAPQGAGAAPVEPPLAETASPAGFLESCRMLMPSADGPKPAERPAPEVVEIRRPAELEAHMPLDALVAFLHEHLKPYEDTPADIRAGVEYALSDATGRGGVVLLAREGDAPAGALVLLNTGMGGYVPPKLLLFVAVRGDLRGRGIGAALVRRAQALSGGDIKLHVEYDNPARRLYERLGFTSKYAEMRWAHEPCHHQS